MAITLEEIANAIQEFQSGTETELPTFGSATIEIGENSLKVSTAEIVWGGYIDIYNPNFKYVISFGECDGGWSYNDAEGYGYGDFISAEYFKTPQDIAREFFLQVTNDPKFHK